MKDPKNETRTFGDVTVTVTEIDAWGGYQLLPRIGMVLGTMAPDANGKMDMGKTLPAMCSAISSDETLLLAMLASTTCTLEGKTFPISDKNAFNVAFTGSLWAVVETVQLILEVSFTDFLSNALSAFEKFDLGPGPKTDQDPSSSD